MTREQLRTLALAALHKANAIKEEYGQAMPSDKLEQFNAIMDEFEQHHKAYEEANATSERFSALASGLETYGAPATEQLAGAAGSSLENASGSGVVVDPAQAEIKRAAAKAAHMEAFTRYLKAGPARLRQEEQFRYIGGDIDPQELLEAGLDMETFSLLGNVDSLGGFLVPPDFQDELIKDVAGASVMRQISRIRQTSRSAAHFMTVNGSGNIMYSSGLTGSFRSEGWVQDGNNIPTQNQPRFGNQRVQTYIWSPDVVEITMELLMDSAVNLESEVRGLLAEVRRLDEDSAFILGTGVGMPTGIHTEAVRGSFPTVNSGAGSAFTYDGLVRLWSCLPAQYRGNARYLLNSKALGEIMLIKDNDNRPIFPTNDIPTQLFGSPIVVSEFMPDVANGNIACIYGDFQNYGIADRQDLRVIRLNERFAPNVGLLAVARVGGKMLRSQPFVSQTIAV